MFQKKSQPCKVGFFLYKNEKITLINMILITKGTNSIFCLTLKEKQTLINPFFLFRFTYFGNEKRVIIPATNTTTLNQWYQFTITENATENLTSGICELKPSGDWKYEVFEQLSSTNLIVANADNQIALEIGIARVIDTNKITYQNPINEIKIIQYGTGT